MKFFSLLFNIAKIKVTENMHTCDEWSDPLKKYSLLKKRNLCWRLTSSVEGGHLYVCSANLTYTVPETVQDADLSCTLYTSSAVTVKHGFNENGVTDF